MDALRLTVLSTPATEQEWDAIRVLLREYAGQLGVDLCFQDFEAELQCLSAQYGPPRGAMLLAHIDGNLAGCCALRPLDNTDYANAGEMKRLYVRPHYRGLGLGRVLAEAILDSARQGAYACVLLDTLSGMETARALYKDLGFVEIPPYYYNPLAGSHYLKVDL